MRVILRTLGVMAMVFFATQQAAADYGYTVLNDQTAMIGGVDVRVDTTTLNNILVGGIHLDQTTDVPPSGYEGIENFTTVCVDLKGHLYLGQKYTFGVAEFDNQYGAHPTWGTPAYPAATLPAEKAIQNAAHLYATYAGSRSGAVQWAGLQLAIWAAIYNTTESGTYSLGDANTRFQVLGDDGGAAQEAASLLTAIASIPLPSNGYIGHLLQPEERYVNGSWAAVTDGQELLIGVTPVPEPSTILAAALLLLPFGASAFRVLRKRNAN